MNRKRILIAGFGDTGVLTAINLPKSYEITAVTTKPLLLSGQELGLRITDPGRWKKDYQIAFSRYRNLEGVNIIHGKVTKIDSQENRAQIKSSEGRDIECNYDALLIASGVKNGFWRTGEVESLESIEASLRDTKQKLASAASLSVIGGGPTAVSAAYNFKRQNQRKRVSLYFPGDSVLSNYPERTRSTITKMLLEQGVVMHPGHRAVCPENTNAISEHETIEWQTGQPAIQPDMCLWAVGQLQPNNAFLPSDMLDGNGFVSVDEYLRVKAYSNVFAVGDIANSDANRSSARNQGFALVAKNIDCYLSGNEEAMKPFNAPKYRWGSILGVQPDEGLRVFTPAGSNYRVGFWWVKTLLFPFFVRKLIYKGVRAN